MQGIKLSRFKQIAFEFKSKHQSLRSFSATTAIAEPNPKIRLSHPIPQTLFQALKLRPSLPKLRRLHARVVALALYSHASLTTSLVNCYLSAKDMNSARKLFESYPSSSPPTLVWNIMIRAYSKLKDSHEPLLLFNRMMGLDRHARALPDHYTFTFVMTSCSYLNSDKFGQSVHGLVVKFGFESDLFVANAIVNMYGVSGNMFDAWKLFDEMAERDVYTWTALLRGYFRRGKIGKACEVFEEMPVRNEVSWAVMISGFVSCKRYIEGLRCFRDYISGEKGKISLNEAMIVSVLSCCANLGALEQGIWIHNCIETNGSELSCNISTALIDMYSKCGRIDRAKQVFTETPKRDVFNYTSMISGLSVHGLGREALQIFSQMSEENILPNDVTILGILNACSHSGLVDEGTSVFLNMESLWGIRPKIEHFGCYIDLLGRAGFLEKAFEVLKTMPMKPDIVIWRALLSSCRIHRNVKLGEEIAKHVDGLDPVDFDRIEGKALLSSWNSSMGKWERVAELREQIIGKRVRLTRGCSWIEVNGAVNELTFVKS